MVLEPGHYPLCKGTSITVAAMAHLIGWVCTVDVSELGDTQP